MSKQRNELKRVLITGANGFLGKNLQLHLSERKNVEVLLFTRDDSPARLSEMLRGVDFVFHLAGVNRPQDQAEFLSENVGLTRQLADGLAKESKSSGKLATVVFTSSIQVALNNPYGNSKCLAEQALYELAASNGRQVHVFRLSNVFGKWCQPNYNSVVATFCHNIARGLPIQVNDPGAVLKLVYVDDVMNSFIQIMSGQLFAPLPGECAEVAPQYQTTVGELADQLRGFRESRVNLMTDRVGNGLTRALFATYVSYLPVNDFSYVLPQHQDSRGVFVEMLKTPDAGQFSYFTALPGMTRGGHYHHSKTEKFLVIKGYARFKFRQIQTGQMHELFTSGEKPKVVETVPGWTHDITNIGESELVVMLWANEVFDPSRPDTIACPV
jgi:UDP-2-acetamido-2,6-beta-L-arabino-hexul-4-ose reductase